MNACSSPARQRNARHCSSPSAARTAMKFTARSRLEEFPADLAEQRRRRLTQPLEGDHLARDDPGALLPQPLEGDVAVERATRGDAVGDDVDLLSLLEQLERRLQEAD